MAGRPASEQLCRPLGCTDANSYDTDGLMCTARQMVHTRGRSHHTSEQASWLFLYAA